MVDFLIVGGLPFKCGSLKGSSLSHAVFLLPLRHPSTITTAAAAANGDFCRGGTVRQGEEERRGEAEGMTMEQVGEGKAESLLCFHSNRRASEQRGTGALASEGLPVVAAVASGAAAAKRQTLWKPQPLRVGTEQQR